MSQVFSTDLVPIADRFDAWLCNARQICGDCRFEFPKGRAFHGSIERRNVAGSELTLFSSSPLAFAKSPIVEANSAERNCIIIAQLKGVQRYMQSGHVTVLEAGDSTIIDSGYPWSSDCPFQCARLYMRLPRWLVENRLRTSLLPTVPRIVGHSGLGATLFRLATSLYQEAEVLTQEEGMAAIEAYLAILSGCLVHADVHAAGGNRSSDMFRRIEHFIEMRLAEPALKPAEIAAAVGISVRHLHRLFEGKNSTVAEWIQQQRLEHCRTELTDPRSSQRSITEIAYGWGFSDSAHFSRCFKKKYGFSPRAFRCQARTNPRNEATFRPLRQPDGPLLARPN